MVRLIHCAGCMVAAAARYLFEPWYGAHSQNVTRAGGCLPGPQRAA